METVTENPTMNHPKDCALCGVLSGTHVYVDPATQARRMAAAQEFNARVVAPPSFTDEEAREAFDIGHRAMHLAVKRVGG